MEQLVICLSCTTLPITVSILGPVSDAESNLFRTLHCSSSQQPAGTAAHPRDIGRTWPRLRIAELQAINAGSDDSKARLSPCYHTKRYHSFMRRLLILSGPKHEAFPSGEMQNGVSNGRRFY